MIEQLLFQPKEIAKMLAISRRTLSRLVATGIFPEPIRLNHKVVRWHKDQITKFIADHIKPEKQTREEILHERTQRDQEPVPYTKPLPAYRRGVP